MSKRHARNRFVGMALALAIVVAACSSQTTPAPATTAGASSTPGGSASASPAGPSADAIIGTGGDGLKPVHEFKGTTEDGQELVWTPSAAVANVTTIQILTTESPSWVAWREIELVGP